MSLLTDPAQLLTERFPRVSGDEPLRRIGPVDVVGFSPRERG